MTTRQPRRFGWPLTLGTLGTLCGALCAVFLVTALQLSDDIAARTQSLQAWGETAEYGVFYPRSNGDDRAELESGDWGSVIAQATDLYDFLDDRGAVFVDSTDFQPGMEGTPGITIDSLVVNAHFLERFPLRSATGDPITVLDTESDWVVAVPDSKRDEEAEISRIVSMSRVGSGEFQGAVQFEEEIFGREVPEHLKTQEVKILWYPAGQDVFSFNTAVETGAGGMIRDPIVEIMTPANSVASDRANAITGDINSALKVKLEGSSAETLARLRPILQDLHLDDNLTALVTPSEVLRADLQSARLALTWTMISVVAFFGVMLIATFTLTTVLIDRQRRAILVQRMHGAGFLRAYRGVLARLGLHWAAQAGLAMVIALGLAATAFDPAHPGAGTPLFEHFPALFAVMILMAAAETLAAAIAATVSERRSAVRRVKEW